MVASFGEQCSCQGTMRHGNRSIFIMSIPRVRSAPLLGEANVDLPRGAGVLSIVALVLSIIPAAGDNDWSKIPSFSYHSNHLRQLNGLPGLDTWFQGMSDALVDRSIWV